MRLFYFTCLLCVGCGDAFQSTPFNDAIDAVDSGSGDVVVDSRLADPPPVDAGAAETTPAVDAGINPNVDAGVDAGIDANLPCTPLPNNPFYCLASASGRNCASSADSFCAGLEQSGGTSWCAVIPAACRCVETYNCDCVMAATPTGKSCSDDAGVVTVVF